MKHAVAGWTSTLCSANTFSCQLAEPSTPPGPGTFLSSTGSHAHLQGNFCGIMVQTLQRRSQIQISLMNWSSVCTWPQRGESLMQCPLCHRGCAIITNDALLTAWARKGAWAATGGDSQPRAACASPAAYCIQPYKQPTKLLRNPAGLKTACPSRTSSLSLQLQTATPHRPQQLGYVAQPLCAHTDTHTAVHC